MSKQDVNPTYEEKREQPRVPLDVPFFVAIRMDSGDKIQAMLIDCGRGGVQLAFSPAETRMGELLNLTVMIEGLPDKIRAETTGSFGVITWVSPERCGVRFLTPFPLTKEELQEMADAL